MIYVALLKHTASRFISSEDGKAATLPAPDYETNGFTSQFQSKMILQMRAKYNKTLPHELL